MNDEVLIAVDPHKAHNTLAVIDPATRTVMAAAEFANSLDGYGQMMRFARRWRRRRWAVEGCHGAAPARCPHHDGGSPLPGAVCLVLRGERTEIRGPLH